MQISVNEGARVKADEGVSDLQLPVRHDHGMKAGTCTSASSKMYFVGGHSNVVSLFFFLLINRTL